MAVTEDHHDHHPRYKGPERRTGPYRPPSATSLVAIASLAIMILSGYGGGIWAFSEVIADQRTHRADIDRNALAITDVRVTQQANRADINELGRIADRLLQARDEMEKDLQARSQDSALLQDVRSELAVMKSQLTHVQANLQELKEGLESDRRGRERRPE